MQGNDNIIYGEIITLISDEPVAFSWSIFLSCRRSSEMGWSSTVKLQPSCSNCSSSCPAAERTGCISPATDFYKTHNNTMRTKNSLTYSISHRLSEPSEERSDICSHIFYLPKYVSFVSLNTASVFRGFHQVLKINGSRSCNCSETCCAMTFPKTVKDYRRHFIYYTQFQNWAAKCKILEILHLFISLDLGDQKKFVKQKQVNIIQLCILCPLGGKFVAKKKMNLQKHNGFCIYNRIVKIFPAQAYKQ